MMRLIDHQQIGGRQVHDLGTDRATVQCLNGCDLNIIQWAVLSAGHDDAVRDANVAQFLTGLGDDLASMRQHQTRIPQPHLLLDDGTGDLGFSCSGGCHHYNTAVACDDAAIKLLNDVALIGARFGNHVAPDRLRGWCRPARAPDLIVISTSRGPSWGSVIRPLAWDASINRSRT